jgi:hypothetical protein
MRAINPDRVVMLPAPATAVADAGAVRAGRP